MEIREEPKKILELSELYKFLTGGEIIDVVWEIRNQAIAAKLAEEKDI